MLRKHRTLFLLGYNRRAMWRWLLLCLLPVGCAAETLDPQTVLLGRAREHVRRALEELPNCTCHVIIEQSVRGAEAGSFHKMPKLERDELYTRDSEVQPAGNRRLTDDQMARQGQSGMLSTGGLGMYPHDVLVTPGTKFAKAGRQRVNGRQTVRYDYQVPIVTSRLVLRQEKKSAHLPYHGRVWLDEATLDLVRLTVEPDELPPQMDIRTHTIQIEYHRLRVGQSAYLLPERLQSEARRVVARGRRMVPIDYRTVTRWERCQEYRGDSNLSFPAQ